MDHRDRTRRILEILRKERLFLKPTKCTFDVQEVDFLGMIIRPGQVAMDPAKLKGISDWQSPTTVKEVRSFLGFCNFYRHFIAHYSDIARPLIDLMKKDRKFDWSPDCQEAFNKLKTCFLSEPVLRNPDPSKQFAIATDASKVATGGVLLQLKPMKMSITRVVISPKAWDPLNADTRSTIGNSWRSSVLLKHGATSLPEIPIL